MISQILNEILATCCDQFECNTLEVCSKSRKQELVYCRKAFSLLIKENFDMKHEVTARILNRSAQDVSRYLITQPTNRYYDAVLKRIRKQIEEIL